MTSSVALVPATERAWGTGDHPPLYCPEPQRIDEELAAEVDDRLVAWAQEVGIYHDQLDRFRDTGFGWLVTLTHADCADPDLLLLAAQLNVGWWAVDDYYVDDGRLGAVPAEAPGHLALAVSAMDTLPSIGAHSRGLDDALRAAPALAALRSGFEHLSLHATHAQVARASMAACQMFMSWNAYAGWRKNRVTPPVWHFLTARHYDSFYPSLTLVDVVDGYELPAEIYYEPGVHRAVRQAGLAAVIVNDLHSTANDAAAESQTYNPALLIAGERNCSLAEAIEHTVDLHNELVRGFEESHRELVAETPSAELRRFLSGVWAWLGGCLDWHSASPRYHRTAIAE